MRYAILLLCGCFNPSSYAIDQIENKKALLISDIGLPDTLVSVNSFNEVIREGDVVLLHRGRWIILVEETNRRKGR
jgi:hypothetical protein